MLCDLTLVASIDDPVLCDPDYVGHTRVALLNADEFRSSVASVYLEQASRGDGLAINAGRRVVVVHKEVASKVSGSLRPVVEPEKHSVVIHPKGYQRSGVLVP